MLSSRTELDSYMFSTNAINRFEFKIIDESNAVLILIVLLYVKQLLKKFQ